MKEYKYIVARALNSYEATSPMTALGIKCLMEQMRSERIRAKLPNILKRKLEVTNKLSLRDYQILKSKGEDGNTYRKVVAPSAFSALMEAEFFRLLPTHNQNSKSVFSYRIPTNKDQNFRNFEYYYENYIQMNKSILSSMIKNKCDSVLIIDLKAFYPSINTKRAIIDFRKAQPVFDSILNTYDLYQEGLPIGLDLSHLIAQHYLKGFDQVLTRQFGNRYFRYVDDISIVCNETDKDEITAYIQSNLPEGLEINPDKLDIAPKATWAGITNQVEERYKLDSFATYLSIYISFNPEISEIKGTLEQHNFHLPLYKFSERVKTSTFNRFFSLLYKERFRLVSSIFRWSNEDLVNFLKNRKTYHLEAVNESIVDIVKYEHAKDITTRFRLQNIKYHLSNLFYLLDDDELVNLQRRLPEHADLFYFGAIVDALINHNFDSLFELGGRYVVILAEMWLTREKESINLDFSSFMNIDNYSESICYLSIVGVLVIDIKSLKVKFENQSEFKFVSSIINREELQVTDCEYTNEMQLLFSRYDDIQLKELLLSKFDKTDDVSFYALEEGAY
mgnify:CR=1 FL=1